MATVRMTEGNIMKHLAGYSIPLILGNLFQLTYNAVDSIIVGRFIGKEALAAVGTAGPIMNILILGISGICVGASVLMSNFFGAGEEELLRKEMATTAVMGVYISLPVVVLGMLVTGLLLAGLRVPEDIRGITGTYVRIIFLGVPFTYVYNALSSALKSVGDSKTPLKFLAFASVFNGVLDLILIGGLGFGIICSAVTTVIAEAVSAVLCIIYIYRRIPLLQLRPREFRMDRALLKKTLRYGGMTALQQSCQPIGKLLIQGAVNPMGVDVIAAFNAVSRVDDFAFTPEQSISHGITTFIAQNHGKKQKERIRAGFRMGLLLESGYWILICGFILLFREPIMGLFVAEGDTVIIRTGSEYLGFMAVLYLLPAYTNGFQGFFRGMGHMKITLAGTMIQISLRVLFVYLLTPFMGLRGVAVACAAGWGMMLAVQVPHYLRMVKKDL